MPRATPRSEPAKDLTNDASDAAPIRGSQGLRPAAHVDDPERYEQVGEHARGGLGRVVRAVDKRLGRTVAVKELLRHDASNEARFLREAGGVTLVQDEETCSIFGMPRTALRLGAARLTVARQELAEALVRLVPCRRSS